MSEDMVNHPPHYNSHPSGVECIDIVEHMPYNIGAAIKYLWRCDLKDAPIEDLRKAAFYVDREIKRRIAPKRVAKHLTPTNYEPGAVRPSPYISLTPKEE